MVNFTDLRDPGGTPDHYWVDITLRAEQLESVNLCSTSHVFTTVAVWLDFARAPEARNHIFKNLR